jgi:hypothetical protein
MQSISLSQNFADYLKLQKLSRRVYLFLTTMLVARPANLISFYNAVKTMLIFIEIVVGTKLQSRRARISYAYKIRAVFKCYLECILGQQ